MNTGIGAAVHRFATESKGLSVANMLSASGTRTRINALGRKWFIAEGEGVKLAILYYDAIYTDGREVFSPLLQKSVESNDLMSGLTRALAEIEAHIQDRLGFAIKCVGITDAPPVTTVVTLLSEAADSEDDGDEDEEQAFTSREERESTVGYEEIQLELFA